MLQFAVGISLVALLLGFLVGVSESPVAGIALTASFGIVATGLALHQRTASGHPPDLPSVPDAEPTKSDLLTALESLGKVLIAFAITFVGGLALGVATKIWSHAPEPQQKLLWQISQVPASAPASARKAIDWIVVRERLRALGYSDQQILEVYRIDADKKKDEDKGGFLQPDNSLLSPILSAAPAASSPGRPIPYIAWDPRPRRGDV